MTPLYSLRTDGDQWRITKFVDGDVESSYLTTHSECDCPAGHRHTCRHRQMLPQMLAHKLCDTHWFFCFDTGGQIVDFNGTSKHLLDQLAEGSRTQEETVQDTLSLIDEVDCPGHAASYDDNKVCRYCGVHIDSLRPNDESVPAGQHYQVATNAGSKSWRRL